MVTLAYPSDQAPGDEAAAKASIVDAWADVATFYDQASYGDLTVTRDVTGT